MGFTKSFGRLGATMDCSLSATISWERARWSYYTCDKKDAKVPGFSGFSPGFVGGRHSKKGEEIITGSPGNGRRCWVGKGWFGVLERLWRLSDWFQDKLKVQTCFFTVLWDFNWWNDRSFNLHMSNNYYHSFSAPEFHSHQRSNSQRAQTKVVLWTPSRETWSTMYSLPFKYSCSKTAACCDPHLRWEVIRSWKWASAWHGGHQLGKKHEGKTGLPGQLENLIEEKWLWRLWVKW